MYLNLVACSSSYFLVNGLFFTLIQNRIKWRRKPGRFTYQPAPSCLPCLSLGAGRGHLLVVFPSAGICSGPGSEPPTSGSVTAATHSLTQQRSPCHLAQDFISICIYIYMCISNDTDFAAEVSELTFFRCRLHSCTLCQQALARWGQGQGAWVV